MLIEHYKKTPIARAPDEVVRATNEYTNHKAVLNLSSIVKPDIYHFHNKPRPGLNYGLNQIIQYHSEPERVDLKFPGVKITLAQYHCLLPQYQGLKAVRNIIPIDDPLYTPAYPRLDKIRVGYSPSHTNTQIKGPFDKGLEVTSKILNKVRKAYPTKFDFDIISGVLPAECMRRKNQCNVVIDEVVTQSYHKCTLEGLALGKATICSMSNEMEAVLKRYAPSIPILNVWKDDLEMYLVYLIEQGPEFCMNIGAVSRQWMESYWRPEAIIQEYINIYKEVLNG